MNSWTGIGLAFMLRELFNGTILRHWNNGGSTPGREPVEGPEPLQAIWHAGSGNGTFEDFRGIVENVTNQLTVHVRQHGEEGLSDFVQGEVHYSTVCLQVNWQWLAYPCAVVALTLLFFVWMVIQAQKDQSRLHKTWAGEGIPNPFHNFKSSSLAVLFHGLDPNSLKQLADIGSTNRQKELAKMSKHTKVQLVPTEQGWKLATANS